MPVKKSIRVSSPVAPPAWALLERELIRANNEHVFEFYDKYFDDRGYLQICNPTGEVQVPIEVTENGGLLQINNAAE